MEREFDGKCHDPPPSFEVGAHTVELAKPGGTIVILGVVYGPLDVPFGSLLVKELRLVASGATAGTQASARCA